MMFIIIIGLAVVLYFNQYMQNKKFKRDHAHFEKRKEQYNRLLASIKERADNKDSKQDNY